MPEPKKLYHIISWHELCAIITETKLQDKLSACYDLTVDGLAEDRLKRIGALS